MLGSFAKIFKGDRVIWGLIVVFMVYSLLAVYSSSVSVAFSRYGGNTTFFLRSQGVMLLFCLFIIVITHQLHYRIYSSLAGFFVLVSIVLLILTLIFGVRINEAARWITIPGTGFRIQTSDLAKVSLVIYIARMLARHQHDLKDFKLTTRIFIVPIAIVCALILPENLSTALLIFGICMIILFIGRVPFKFILAWLGMAIAGVILLALLLDAVSDANRVATWKARVENFISGDEDKDGDYQANQAKIAIATGGLIGKAPGNSVQRNMLPQSNSDFIFAIIIEEYGLLFGAIPLLFVYLILLFRGIATARKCETAFPAFLVLGLTVMIVVQAILNMAVAVGLFPVTGQTLPMISWGRTSLLITSFSLGAILGVSRVVNARANNEESEEENSESEQDGLIYEGATT
ncbi:MAG: FtsW/RodA/SpoVE family cell cycle protein [Marinilabiliaceae bacterium]|jgi:cell division protein FtsW|nr:FtsW/RodA/SpoVE family cell cycle protein [Marinilabiliaceae bacterium]